MVEGTKITNNDLQGIWEYSRGNKDHIKYIFSRNNCEFYTDDNWHFKGEFNINGSTLKIIFPDGSSISKAISLSDNNLTLDNTTYIKKTSSDHSGCYIATCVYDSYDCPEVWTLRRYRDSELSASCFGRRFIRIYYALSPKIVKLFGNKKWFNGLWKPVLDKIVNVLHNIGINNDPYSDK